MASQLARKDLDDPLAAPTAPPGAAVRDNALDPLITALSRAVDRSRPAPLPAPKAHSG